MTVHSTPWWADLLFAAQVLAAAVSVLLVVARAPDLVIAGAAAVTVACVVAVPLRTYRLAAVSGPPDDVDRVMTLGHRGPWMLRHRLLVVAWLAGSTIASAVAEVLIRVPLDDRPSVGVALVAAGQPVGLLSVFAAIVVVESLGPSPERANRQPTD